MFASLTRRLLYALLGILVVLVQVSAYPSRLGCTQDARSGRIMGATPAQSTSISVSFIKNGQPLACGGTFTATDTLSVDFSLSGQYILDVTGASFSNPNRNCANRLFQGNGDSFSDTTLTSLGATVSVYGARAASKSQVTYTATCTVTRTTSAPTPVPAPGTTPAPTPVVTTKSPTAPPVDGLVSVEWSSTSDWSSFLSGDGFANVDLGDVVQFQRSNRRRLRSLQADPGLFIFDQQSDFQDCNFDNAQAIDFNNAGVASVSITDDLVADTGKVYFASDANNGADCTSERLKLYVTVSNALIGGSTTTSGTSSGSTNSGLVLSIVGVMFIGIAIAAYMQKDAWFPKKKAAPLDEVIIEQKPPASNVDLSKPYAAPIGEAPPATFASISRSKSLNKDTGMDVSSYYQSVGSAAKGRSPEQSVDMAGFYGERVSKKKDVDGERVSKKKRDANEERVSKKKRDVDGERVSKKKKDADGERVSKKKRDVDGERVSKKARDADGERVSKKKSKNRDPMASYNSNVNEERVSKKKKKQRDPMSSYNSNANEERVSKKKKNKDKDGEKRYPDRDGY